MCTKSSALENLIYIPAFVVVNLRTINNDPRRETTSSELLVWKKSNVVIGELHLENTGLKNKQTKNLETSKHYLGVSIALVLF